MAIQVDELLKILLEHPAEIEKQSNDFYALVTKEQDLQRELDALEYKVFARVTTEVDVETGKPVFTNDKLRAAETNKRLVNLEAHQQLTRAAREVFLDKQRTQGTIDRLKREHRGAIAAANLFKHIAGDTDAE